MISIFKFIWDLFLLLFYFCGFIFACYFTYILAEPYIKNVWRTASYRMDKDVELVKDYGSNVLGLSDESYEVTRVKYPDYNWNQFVRNKEYIAAPAILLIEAKSEENICHHGMLREMKIMTNDVVDEFINKLPSNNSTATDEEIDAAIAWKDEEMEKIINDLKNCYTWFTY